jgi:zinc transporter 9
MLMMVVEQLVAPHSHSHSHYSSVPSGAHDAALPLHSVGQQTSSTVEFDAELGDLEQPDPPSSSTGFMQVDMDEIKGSRARAYPLTFGLIMHGLADGLALGVSSLSAAGAASDSHRDLSFIVFLALIIHKGDFQALRNPVFLSLNYFLAPTSLALTTSLLNTSLPRPECRKHLAFFSASTPVGAIVSYALLSFFSAGAQGTWTGLALLVSVRPFSVPFCR